MKHSKKSIQSITLLLFFALFAFISSCKKGEKDPETIIGKWSVKSYVITNFENGGVDVDDTKNESPRPIFEFKADGTFSDTLEGGIQTTTYTLSGDKVTFGEGIAFGHNSFTYTMSGSVLTLKRTDNRKTPGNVTYTENTTITLERL